MPNSNRAFQSVRLVTYYHNGTVIDSVEYDGTLNGIRNLAEDIKQFEDVWEPEESYRVYVNGIEVDDVECFDEATPVDGLDQPTFDDRPQPIYRSISRG